MAVSGVSNGRIEKGLLVMTSAGIDFQGVARNLEYNPIGGIYLDVEDLFVARRFAIVRPLVFCLSSASAIRRSTSSSVCS